jgi:uncharacterized protein (DUF2267 family)
MMDEDRFLHEIEMRTGLPRDKAFNAAIAVLQELHDRLSSKEADDVAAQLPGEFKARWHAFDAPGRQVRRTHRADFVRHIAEVSEIDELQANRVLVATFAALQMLLGTPGGQGEAWDVFSQLPKDLKQLWLQASGAQKKPARPARSAPR